MKVLITSVSAGAGHVRAAEAVETALRQLHPSVQVKHVDVMDYVSSTFRKLYVEGYVFTVNRIPKIWGRLYGYTDGVGPGNRLDPFINSFQRRHAQKFFEFLNEYKPDVILTTHFLIPQLLSTRPAQKWPPIECVITDYDLHRFWVNPLVSRYFVGREAIVDQLAARNVNPNRIAVTGIPIHPAFLENVSKAVLLQKLGLEPGVTTVLLLSGGLGFGALEKTAKTIFSLNEKFQIATVSGKNNALRNKLENLKTPPGLKMINLGFVSNMPELLTVSDIVVTKAGGLTVSECLAKGNAMVLYAPIPGQEEKNANYLESIGAGIKALTPKELTTVLTDLLKDSKKVWSLKSAALKASRPRAAYSVAVGMASSFISA